MKTLKLLLLAVLVLIIAAVIYIYTSINDVVKKGIETIGSDVLGVQVTVSNVNISLKDGSAEINGLNIGNPEGYKSANAFSLGKVRLAIEPSSIAGNVVHIKDISVVSPKINYEFSGGKSNIATIKEKIGSKGSGSKSSSDNKSQSSDRSQKSFVIDNILFTDGSVNTYIAQLEKSIALPEIKLQNIGSQSNPASAKQVATVIISEIVKDLTQNAKLQALSSDIQGAAKALKERVKGMDGGIKELKGMFGR